jgi:putative ABC transport system permease protein
MMSDLVRDVTVALRSLLKSPGFALITIVTLALGIGANTAIFSVVNAVLLRPLAYQDPDRLVVIRETYSGGITGSVSGANFVDWRDRSRSFTGMTAIRTVSLALVGADEPIEIRGARVSAEFFRVLGVDPIIGRAFAPGEDQGEPAVAVIGEQLWRDRFSGDPDILRRTIRLSGRDYPVIGVAPASFNYWGLRDVWLPFGFGTGTTLDRDSHSYDVVARLRPEVSLEQATADLVAVAQDLEREYPEANSGRSVEVAPLGVDAVRVVRPVLLVLIGAVTLVLLIACANVANLFLARAVARQREIAVRAALGAGRWRLARQVLVEAAILTVGGTALGLLLAAWAVDALIALAPPGLPRVREVGIDTTVLLFTVLVSVVVGTAFGVLPALHVAGLDPADSVRGEGRGTSGGIGRHRVRTALVIGQISLALVLLVGATLLIVSVRRLGAVDPGFRPEGVATFQLGVAGARHPDAAAQLAFVQRVIDRLEAIPGVEHGGAVFYLPLGSGDINGDITMEGDPQSPPGQEKMAGYRLMGGDYLNAAGLSLLRGRALTRDDRAGSTPVAVVNQTFVRRYLGGRDPIGARVTFGTPDSAAVWREIVGIVGDVRHRGLSTDPGPEIYVPILQLAPDFWSIFTPTPLSFLVRSSLPFASLAPEIRRAVREVDPEQPVAQLREGESLLTDATARQRFSMVLLALFGALALTLAAIGVYGVMAYGVSQRTRELGIRLALGARPGSVRMLVLGQGLGMALIGIGLGLLGAVALGRLLTSLLYGVGPADPRVLATGALVLGTVSLLASLVPAIRATRVDPINALRSE